MGKESTTGTDGDEFTIKDGIKVSKFSKEAMEIGFDVGEELKRYVYDQFENFAARQTPLEYTQHFTVNIQNLYFYNDDCTGVRSGI